jgi:hypothetical protein
MNDTTETTREKFLTDLLVTAVEGGINYWAGVEKYDHSGPAPERGVTLVIGTEDLDELNLKVPVLYVDDDRERFAVRVELKDLHRGIKALADGIVQVGGVTRSICQHANDHDDAASDLDSSPGDVDADVADCIMQAAVFGEVIFG